MKVYVAMTTDGPHPGMVGVFEQISTAMEECRSRRNAGEPRYVPVAFSIDVKEGKRWVAEADRYRIEEWELIRG